MCSQIRPLIRNELRVSDNFEVQGNSGVQGPGFGVQGLGVRVEGFGVTTTEKVRESKSSAMYTPEAPGKICPPERV